MPYSDGFLHGLLLCRCITTACCSFFVAALIVFRHFIGNLKAYGIILCILNSDKDNKSSLGA